MKKNKLNTAIITGLLKLSVKPVILSIYYIFCILSILLASALRWYANFPGWDKILHFISGFLIAFIGIALFHSWKNIYSLNAKSDSLFFLLYTICFTLAGAIIVIGIFIPPLSLLL